jgi:hypothetical protein
VAPPAAKIAPAIDDPAAPMAAQAFQPQALAAEPGGRANEGNELIDMLLGAAVAPAGGVKQA